MKTANRTRHTYRFSGFLLFTGLLTIYIFLPQLQSFRTSLQTIRQADWAYILLAIMAFTATYFAAALSYCLITYFRLAYLPTLLVQVADGFTNRIVPAGLGAVATNVLYLIKQSKSGIKAGYVAGLNNLIGFIAHLLILIILLMVSRQSPRDLFHLNVHLGWLSILFIVLAILTGAVFWRRLKPLSIKSYDNLVAVLASSLKRPLRLVTGLLAAMAVTVLYGLTLLSVMLALNVHLSILQTFLALTVSVLAVTITPTPGGLGGVEASLVAALMSFKVAAGPALSVALVYRFITYWLPIIPGAIALRIAVDRNYLTKAK